MAGVLNPITDLLLNLMLAAAAMNLNNRQRIETQKDATNLTTGTSAKTDPIMTNDQRSRATSGRALTRAFLLCIAFWSGIARSEDAAGEGKLNFNRDIRPILSDNCFACHGPDQNDRQAELRLDARDDAIAAGAIVPGDAQASGLVIRILTTDSSLRMPPAESGKELTQIQKERLTKWLEQGAEYQQHWAFVPLTPIVPPAVAQTDWPRNALDRFVSARLEHDGLSPSPEATRETLIRRLTLDLTGIPPTVQEVEAFVSDTSPMALETVVDRLLASPLFGEQMAIPWLDAARYADSNGYQVDRDRELWAWRDWVINAFNRNLPFDQFTIEQIAGDLLPDASLEQRIASGFHRNHMLNEEGGIIPEEFLAEYTADRVETTAAVWLGQTFNCTRCHDHKFDPFTQRDFYSLKAFFHNVPERGVGSYGSPIRQNAPPFIKLPAPSIEHKIADLGAKLKAVSDQLAILNQQTSDELDAWVSRVANQTVTWNRTEPSAADGSDLGLLVDSALGAFEVCPNESGTLQVRVLAQLPAGRVTAIRLECSSTAAEQTIQWTELKVQHDQPLPLHAIVTGDSLPSAETVKLLDGNEQTKVALALKPDPPVHADFTLATPLEIETTAQLQLQLGLEAVGAGSRWRLLITDADTTLMGPPTIIELAKKEAGLRTAGERQQLLDFRLSQSQEYNRLKTESEALKQQIANAELEIPTTLVMEELPEPRATFVLMRGAYDKPGEQVTANTPAALPPMDKALPRNRLGLAQWLVSPANPLTARVTVNRFWQQAFGNGLVITSEDFGSQGGLPSHPELLDWLATEFIRTGWDVKRLMKLIATSATYRQQSKRTAQPNQSDPDNRLLTRGPRFRLSAETIRDQALAVSRLLVSSLGGPSVRPYHPPGLYEQVTAGSGYNVYVAGTHDELFRRSLYTYWKRSVPHPAMLLFDAPFRETCTLRRSRSNTPLQALNLLNDPTYVEAAKFFALRMMSEAGESIASRLSHGFRLLLAREPNPEELAILRTSLDRARADFRADPESATALLAIGSAPWDTSHDPVELAAFATVAAILLNLDEAVTKE